MKQRSVTIHHPVGICSLAVSFPSTIRTNDYWLAKYPQLAKVEPRRARQQRHSPTSDTFTNNGLDIWSQAVAPYLADPFRGNVERRVLGADESALTLEVRAAREALTAANLAPTEVELAIASSLFSEQITLGHATYLAQQLELHCPAWNLESTCSSALVALQNACALVQAGAYRNVLVVVSQIGSQAVAEEDTLSRSMGDGAGAFVVSSLQPQQGILGMKIVPTTSTCGAYSYELVADAQGKPRICTRTGENASALAETAVDFVRTCCKGAVAAANLTLDRIDFFAFNAPTAWYTSVCARALDIPPERTIDLYPRYANIGPVLPLANLYHAAQEGKIRENDLVLVYTNGAAATAAATVMRWGDVALGAAPTPPIDVTHTNLVLWHDSNLDRDNRLVVSNEKLVGLSRETLLATKSAQRHQILQSYVLEWLAHSLQLPLTQLNPQQSLVSLLDSLLAVALKSRIESDLAVRVPMEKFIGNNTIAHLAEFVLYQLALTDLVTSKPIVATEGNEKREQLSI
ncbi:3-oxoacyl-ACP synthase [Cyanosarcina cf. burmensis CCALA 770]|nr:3-oxoacyl-ACP synthase [Cyanosarcina cf. burmensis CCALA 770]